MPKIVLTTIGTLGDLHPFIALGLALKQRGFRPVMAVAEDQVDKARAAGLEAVAVLPSFASICAQMGVGHDEAVRRLASNQRRMLEKVILPALSTCALALDAVTEGAAAIVSSGFVLAAPIIAEKRGIPLISVVLQPMAMLSPHDPPHTPDFWMMKGAPDSAIGVWWNRAVYAAAREMFHRMYGRRIDPVRANHALAPRGARKMFDAGREAALTLCCYSPAFGPLPPDAPSNTRIVGFPIFDSHSGAPETLEPVLAKFLASGPPPIVFTLGSFVVHSARNFYDEAATVTRQLGQRAVLLVGGNAPTEVDGDILRCAYAPHSLIFPRAAAIVHHGGAGTTGQALRAGKPQLVVPHMGDQNDHAHRIQRMGIGRKLRGKRFTAERAAPLIAQLLGNAVGRAEAARIGRIIAAERGAETAAAAIASYLSYTPAVRQRTRAEMPIAAFG